jgi:hypothetical protein
VTTIRSTLARFALPLIGVYLLLVGLGLVFSLAVPALLLGIIALFAGICSLCAS